MFDPDFYTRCACGAGIPKGRTICLTCAERKGDKIAQNDSIIRKTVESPHLTDKEKISILQNLRR
jgi:hypothetical protein